jgi:FemAB family protein
LKEKDWQVVMKECPYIPVSATRSMIEYQNCYFKESDTSKVLYENNKPIGIWPGIIGEIYQPPLFIAGISEKVQKKAIESILYENREGLKTATDFYMNNTGLSIWSQKLIELGAEVKVKYDLYCDLTQTEEQIWAGVRGSYHSLINKASNDYFVFVSNFATSQGIIFYQQFHHEVSGKQTRNSKTWDLQAEAINSGSLFVINIKKNDISTPVIGYSFFNISSDECLYSVAVYDRELTENQGVPLGHLTIWEAIKYAKKLGIKWFKLGEWQIDGNDKERSISKFKKGFASHVFPRFKYDF